MSQKRRASQYKKMNTISEEVEEVDANNSKLAERRDPTRVVSLDNNRPYTPVTRKTSSVPFCCPRSKKVGGMKNKEKRKTRKKTKGKTKRKWSKKYKDSINCKKPKGFSQRQHCLAKSKKRKIANKN
jgi:hypothetical protein